MNPPLDWRRPAPGEGLFATRDLHLVRRGRRILQDVNLQAHPGRVLALIGPNGAGKSSLLQVMAGWIAPSLGSVTLDGRPLAAWAAAALARRRAMLAQDVSLQFAFRAQEVVMLGRMPAGARAVQAHDADVVAAALDLTHASHLRQRNYLELSGGEQKRVQLARVLAQVWDQDEGPCWLLLDEPEAGLDIAHQHDLLRQVRRLSRQGYGVIVVLHDLNLAARYADDVALLTQGRLARLGTPEHVLDPETLSRVYGVAMRRLPIDDAWVLLAH